MTEKTTSSELNIKETQLADALSERYLAYALSTIVDRALPDVRDGLKPVHRRLLYAMRQLRLDPNAGFKKCARVVGDVIGKYHPHGDVAVYEAMVRLAQDFAVRYPLVDGQGNFGNIDGDKAAAMRYTEARLTPMALALMEGLDDDAVDFNKTYDGEEEEPVVMPASVPNLLANGSSGIAVGMATNIPPHNMEELCDALLYLNKHRDASVEKLTEFILAPDFPTGGILIENKETITKAYETGKGTFRLRARWEKEECGHGQYQIVITEIPYQVQKSDLISKIAKLLSEKKLPLLNDIRDESSEDVRIVLEPKSRTTQPEQLMEHLFKFTDLQVNFNMNLNVLDADRTPKVMNLKEVLIAFLVHRENVLIRRSQYRLDKILRRMEIVQGLITAFLNLDRVIEIIRQEDDPKPVLSAEFNLTEIQVEAILNTKLRSLRKLDEQELNTEYDALTQEKTSLEELLTSVDLRHEKISLQLKQTKKLFGKSTVLGQRKTSLEHAPIIVEVPLEAMLEKELITIALSKLGWIRSFKGQVSPSDMKFKEGDGLHLSLTAYTTDTIVFFGSNGRFYSLLGGKISGGRGFGEPIRLSIDLPANDQIIDMHVYKPDEQWLVASEKGKGFIVKSQDMLAQTRNGKTVLNLAEHDKAKICTQAHGDAIAVIGTNRRMLIFKTEEIPVMTRGLGVILQKYQEAKISDIKFFNLEDGLSYPSGNGIRIEKSLVPWIAKRATIGKIPPIGFPRSNKF